MKGQGAKDNPVGSVGTRLAHERGRQSTSHSPERWGLAALAPECSLQPLLAHPGIPTRQGELEGRPVHIWAAVCWETVL